jgi:glycosyltransferase involved in cell wall biosynthesis
MIDESRSERPTCLPSAPAARVSVVVPVYNRSRELRRLLHALAGQTFSGPQIEVLVCDDGSTEDLTEVLQEFEGKLQLVYLRQANLGPGAARNVGLQHARGELVAFTDSDCIPAPTWLDEIIRPLSDASVGIVGGNIDYARAEHLSGQCINFLMSSTLGAAGARNPRSAVHMKYYPRAGNLAVRRDLALAAGGFPAVSHGEDLEFSHRVMQLGARAEFAELAQVIHNERRGVGAAACEAFKKGEARVRLAAHLGMHEVIHGLPTTLCTYLAVLCCAAALRWDLLPWLAVPGYVYVAALGILAVQGAIALRCARAGALVPVYAVAMHIGYGLGYVHARVRRVMDWVSSTVASRWRKPLKRPTSATGVGSAQVK